MIRVLVVDDSAFARKVLREALSSSREIEVVDIARDGLEALEKIAQLKPDVVTLDLVMPNLDGLGVLRALPRSGAPRVVVVSMSASDSELAMDALQLGAVDLVHKPTALATDRLYELSAELVRKVIAAAGAQPRLGATPVTVAPSLTVAPRTRLVVVGASTGGPQALTRLVTSLPADFPVPMALVLHIPAEYTGPFAERLDASGPLDVVEAYDGIPLQPGRVVVARGGMHLKVARRDGRLVGALDLAPLGTPHRPAVDVLFKSAADIVGVGVLGVVLTGMGDDGLSGARDIRAAGGRTLTEAESSCVVYGMPRAVVEGGLSDGSADLGELTALLMRSL